MGEEEVVEFSCLGVKLNGELTEQVALKLRTELEKIKKRKHSEASSSGKKDKDASTIVLSGDMGDNVFESLSLVADYLHSVDISENEEMSDLIGLSQALPNLKHLALEQCHHLSDLAPLTKLQDLTILNIKHVPLQDLAPLARLRLVIFSSMTLIVRHVTNLPSTFSNLEELGLFHSGTVNDISLFTSMKNLRTLQIPLSDVTDISGLTELTNLENLSLRMAPINSIDGLTNCTKMKKLDLHSTYVDNISALPAFGALTSLCLAGTSCEDYSCIQFLVKLRHLDLNLSSFSQLEVIQFLPMLHTLLISHCPIPAGKWEYLVSAGALCELNLSFTSFNDCRILGATLHILERIMLTF